MLAQLSAIDVLRRALSVSLAKIGVKRIGYKISESAVYVIAANDKS